jgi:PEGA domain
MRAFPQCASLAVRGRLLLGQAVLATVFAAEPASAQLHGLSILADVRSELPPAAQGAWDSAKQLAAANDFKGALVEFERAYEVSRNPRVLYNVGVTEKLLTHYARAVDAWDKELREGAKTLTAAETLELKNAIAIVQRFVTTLEVTANEAGATLYIDDYPIGKTPFAAPVRIDIGKRTLTLRKEGFVDAMQSVDVASGARTPVTFRLEPRNKTALVSVTVGGAPSATVFVDGKDMGPAPFKGELPAERHTIEARSPGFVTVGQTVDVQYGQPLGLVLSLSAERHEGRLRITVPEGAEIALDEHKVGSGTWEGVVSTTGGHQLVVSKPGFQTYSTEVFVGDDQSRDVDVPLNKEVATNWVAWGVGTLLVVTGGIVAGYFVFKPADPSPYTGNLTPGIQPASSHAGIRF